MDEVLDSIKKLPLGHSEGLYQNKKYGISTEQFNNGRSYKVHGAELGGTDIVSLNYYCTANVDLLRPCEMSRKKVIDFLKNVELINNK